MNNSTMLYKAGKSITLDCGTFDTIIVPNSDVDKELKNGWSLHPLECSEPNDTKNANESKERNTVQLKNNKLYNRENNDN